MVIYCDKKSGECFYDNADGAPFSLEGKSKNAVLLLDAAADSDGWAYLAGVGEVFPNAFGDPGVYYVLFRY